MISNHALPVHLIPAVSHQHPLHPPANMMIVPRIFFFSFAKCPLLMSCRPFFRTANFELQCFGDLLFKIFKDIPPISVLNVFLSYFLMECLLVNWFGISYAMAFRQYLNFCSCFRIESARRHSHVYIMICLKELSLTDPIIWAEIDIKWGSKSIKYKNLQTKPTLHPVLYITNNSCEYSNWMNL